MGYDTTGDVGWVDTPQKLMLGFMILVADTIVLAVAGLVQNEYGVVSTYVPRMEEMGENASERWEVSNIVA